jgi:hypothetical protein
MKRKSGETPSSGVRRLRKISDEGGGDEQTSARLLRSNWMLCELYGYLPHKLTALGKKEMLSHAGGEEIR